MVMRFRSVLKSTLSSTLILALIATAVATAPAAASPTDLPIVLDLDRLSQFENAAGTPITVVDDSTVDAERTVNALGADGTSVQIVVYSAEPSTGDPEDLVALANTTEPTLDDLAPSPLDTATLVPQVVTASTPTTLTVAWTAPAGADQFALLVDGELAAEGVEPNFTLTGLLPDQPYSLSLRSTHAVLPIEPPNPPVPTEECPEPALVHTTELTGWDLSQTRSAGHSVLVATGLRVFTDDASPQAKAAGYYPVTIPLTNVPSASLSWTGTAAQPGLQLVTDFNGDASPDGILIGESAYGEDFWLSNSAAQFVKAGAPSHTPGSGSANHGLLPEWISTFPDAQILAIGYSLGSGVLGDGKIDALVVGCTSYTFGLAEAPTTDRPVDTSMELSIATRPETTPASRRSDPSNSATAGAPIKSTEFRYQTFIPYPRIADSPDIRDLAVETACIAGYQASERLQDREVFDDNPLDLTFKGDDRPYTAPLTENEQNYRTMMSFRWDWDTSEITRRTDVGRTEIVRKDSGDVVAERTANTSRMTFTNVVESSNSLSVVFNHVANDPFCPSGAVIGAPELGSITYKARLTMFKSGLTLVEGYRANMPAHEGWVRWNDQSKWSNVIALKANRLACLLQQNVPILNIVSDCIGAVKGSVNRSTDKWVAASSNPRSGTLALTKSGRTYGWGGYQGGIIEPFAQGDCKVLETVEVPLDSNGKTIRAKQITATDRHGTAILKSGEIVTWGRSGNLGRDGDSTRALPVSPVNFKEYATYDRTTYAVAESGDLYAWGDKLFDFSEYPYPDPVPSWPTPQLVVSEFDFVDVAITEGTVIALDEDGDLWGYGNNTTGLLGDRDPSWTPAWTPIPVSDVNFVNIDAIYDTAMALDDQGRAWTWGTLRTPVVSDDEGFAGPVLVDTDARFKTLTGGNELSLLTTGGDAHVISPNSSFDTFIETTLPDSGEELVFVADGLAITRHGEMLSFDGAAWTNRGLPPTTTPKDPPRACYSDS